MRRTKLLLVAALALTICLPSVSWAFTVTGWQETGAEVGSLPFTKIEIFTDAATTLTDPVLIVGQGWTSTLVNSHYSVATGPPPGLLGESMQFPDPGITPIEVEYLVWNGTETTPNSQQHMWFTAGGYGWPTGTRQWGYYDGDGVHDFYGNVLPSRLAIPLPPSALLLGSGLLGLGLVRFRGRKNKA